jgi:hypothetical protein
MNSARRFWISIALLSLLHLIVTLICLLASFSFAMQCSESEMISIPWYIDAVNMLCSILMFPLGYIWHVWAEGFPDLIEWIMFVLNSVVWGSVLAVFWHRLRAKRTH